MLLNNRSIAEQIKEEILKMPGDKWKWKHNPKICANKNLYNKRMLFIAKQA